MHLHIVILSLLDVTNHRIGIIEIAIDCRWSEFREWTSCSDTCGATGVRQRTRTIVQEAVNGGKECLGCNNETEICKSPECPVKGL